MLFNKVGNCIDALERLFASTRHGNAKIAIHKRNDFQRIHRIQTDFFAKKRRIVLQHGTIDTEIRHEKRLELAFDFFLVQFLPHFRIFARIENFKDKKVFRPNIKR